MTGSWIPVFGSIVQALYGAAFCFSHQTDRKRIFSRLPVLPPQIHAHCSKMMQEILTDIFLSKRYNGYTNDISGISPQSLPAYPNVRRLQPRIFLNATGPIFLMMVFGLFLRKVGILDEDFANRMNKFVFKIPLPFLLFGDLAAVDFSKVWNIKFIVFCFVVTLISITISTLVSCLWRDKSIRGE